jgi:L-ascorbate metabolism protein UlaG (beta-lactamase superfamily)
VEITWLGHSCFRLKGSRATIITDPYPAGAGYDLGQPTANIVTVSHDHANHNNVAAVGGQPYVISRPGEYEISDILIIGVATYHDDEAGKARGKNTVYLIEIDDLSVCHLGDLGHALTSAQIEEIGKVDVLLLPVGGTTTINAATAAEVVRQLEPKVVIPMHYRTPAYRGDLETAEKFLKEMGSKPVTSQPKLAITKSNVPAGLQIILLDYPGSTPA